MKVTLDISESEYIQLINLLSDVRTLAHVLIQVEKAKRKEERSWYARMQGRMDDSW